MKNFGLSELVLVAPRCSLDDRARALASHADDLLESARVVETLEGAIGDRTLVLGTSARLRTTETLPVLTPREAAPRLLREGTAVVFGPEDHGLNNEELNLCQGYVSIPTADYSSLNLAQAVLVVAYEVHAADLHEAFERAPRPEDDTPAPREQLERFYGQLVHAFHTIGYTDDQRERATERLFRGLFDRVALSAREVAALRGLVSQVEWAAEQAPERLPGRNHGR